MIVNVDGYRDAFGAGFEASEGGLLVHDDEWNIGAGDRGGDEEQSEKGIDQRRLNRIRHEIVKIRATKLIGGEERRRRNGDFEKEPSDKLGTQKCGTIRNQYDDFLDPTQISTGVV